MDPTLRNLLIARLDASDLAVDARDEVLAETGPPAPGRAAANGGEVYLRSVVVEGFRGIGPPARLELAARPGLTVVVGRNGSGKSSFAEGLELLLTGRTKRWESKTKGWTSAWQCLHHDQPTRLEAELVVAGRPQPVALRQTWDRGVAHTDGADRATVAGVLAEHGWDVALESFRPFLAYAELASMFDKLTSLYEALSPILGLEDVDDVLVRLSTRRLELERHVKELKLATEQLRASLAADDPRQVALAALLAKRAPDLAAVREHLGANPPGMSATDSSLRAGSRRSTSPTTTRSRAHAPRWSGPSRPPPISRRPMPRGRWRSPTSSRARSSCANRRGRPTTARSAAPAACSTQPGRRTPRSRHGACARGPPSWPRRNARRRRPPGCGAR